MWDLYKEFLEELNATEGYLTPKWKKAYDTFVMDEDKPIQEFTKEDFIRVLNKLEIRRSASFDNRKYQLSRYIRYLMAHGKCDYSLLKTLRSVSFKDVLKEEDNTFYESYFASLNELLECVMEIIEQHLQMNYNYEYDDILSAMILLWYDFNENEMPEILKADLDPQNHTIKKPSTGEIVEIEKSAFDIIYRYSNTTSRRLRKFGRDTLAYEHFIDSQYLFRSMKSPKVAPNVANRYIHTMKEWGVDSDKVLLPTKIRLSGIYYRIYVWENENGSLLDAPTEFKLKMLGIKKKATETQNLRAIRQEYRIYNIWKNFFYGEDD